MSLPPCPASIFVSFLSKIASVTVLVVPDNTTQSTCVNPAGIAFQAVVFTALPEILVQVDAITEEVKVTFAPEKLFTKQRCNVTLETSAPVTVALIT